VERYHACNAAQVCPETGTRANIHEFATDSIGGGASAKRWWACCCIRTARATNGWPGNSPTLIVTLNDATGEIYSAFQVEEEGTLSSFLRVAEVIAQYGLFNSLYTDRGSHYWHTEKAGGKVDKVNFTQFGRAMAQLGIEMIAAYSPQARGRSERAFRTLQRMGRISGSVISEVRAPRTALPFMWRFVSRTPLTSGSKCCLSILNIPHHLCEYVDLLRCQVFALALDIAVDQVNAVRRNMPVVDHSRTARRLRRH
jgi:hypothetical protein